MSRKILALLVLLCAVGSPPAEGAPQYYVTEVGRYTLRYSVDWLTPRRARIRAYVTIPSPPDKIWEVLTGYEHLADFIPDMKLSRIIRRQPNRLILHQRGVIWFPFYQRDVEVVLQVEEHPRSSVSFGLIRDRAGLPGLEKVRDDFIVYEGGWKLESDGKTTRISYETVVEPSFWMPDWVLTEMQRQTLKRTFRAVIQRCLS